MNILKNNLFYLPSNMVPHYTLMDTNVTKLMVFKKVIKALQTVDMIGGKRAFLDFEAAGDLPCDEKHFKTCHVSLMYTTERTHTLFFFFFVLLRSILKLAELKLKNPNVLY